MREYLASVLIFVILDFLIKTPCYLENISFLADGVDFEIDIPENPLSYVMPAGICLSARAALPGFSSKTSINQSLEEVMFNVENAMYKDKPINRNNIYTIADVPYFKNAEVNCIRCSHVW